MIDELKEMIDEQCGGSPASASAAVDQALYWKVPVQLISWQTSGRRKQVVLTWMVHAPTLDRAAEIVHSMAGRLVGQTLVTSEKFQNPKRTTNRFEVYKIIVQKEEISMIKDLENELDSTQTENPVSDSFGTETAVPERTSS